MVKVTSLLALSATIAVAFGHIPAFGKRHAHGSKHPNGRHGHGHHMLEKRAATAPEPQGCSSTYTPVAAGAWPVLDCIPFIQDPQVQTWLKLVDMTKVPVYPLSNNGLCPTDLTTIPKDQCWWTCQKCDAPADIVTCPKQNTWGLTFDDGPSPDSPRLYDALLAHNQKATLFIVGSRAVSYPETLKRAYNEGHQIAIHTWSHPSMTSLSNEQVVAELRWTEKAIFSIIGVTPLWWRPPFGDVDNRVRAIATQLGYKTSIWTQDFDTNDWNIPAGTATPQSVIDTFKSWLVKIPTMATGFIVLEHDLFPQEVDVSVNGVLPLAFADKSLVMEPIAKCIGDGKPYKEGAGTFVLGGTPAPAGASSAAGGSGSTGTSTTVSGSAGAAAPTSPTVKTSGVSERLTGAGYQPVVAVGSTLAMVLFGTF
ncbi:chitin deacetylase [Mortierella antarctica]|nr:chitin deacetylase [Mortierella antarctica]